MKLYPEGVNAGLCKVFTSVEEIKQAIETGQVFEGRVLLCDRDHNLHLDLGALRGIIPRNEGALGILEGEVRDIALISKVNKRVCFRVKGLHRDEYGNLVAILSRRSVQIDAMAELNALEIGDVIEARVTHLESFGAFIDIGAGINSLIPIDMLSVSRISSPSERLREGQLIRTVLRRVDGKRLTFSLKELLGTWLENASLFSVGETVTGVVRSIEPYGVFIELMPNLAGLAEPCDDLMVGQSVSVYIKSILPEKMKIKLVIVDAFGEIAPVGELVYFEEAGHISRWDYSPPHAVKQIETDFDATVKE